MPLFLSKANNAPQQTDGVSENHPPQQEGVQETGKEDRDGEWDDSITGYDNNKEEIHILEMEHFKI